MSKTARLIATTFAFTLLAAGPRGEHFAVAQPATAPAAAGPVHLVSTDHTVSMDLPDGWTQTKPLNPKIVIKTESAEGLALCVMTTPRDDVADLDAYAKLSHDTDTGVLKDVQAEAPGKLTVNGLPAVRYDYTYTAGPTRFGRVEIIAQTPTQVCVVTVDGTKSRFNAHKEEWAKLVNGLADLSAAHK